MIKIITITIPSFYLKDLLHLVRKIVYILL